MSNCLLKSSVERELSSTQTAARSSAAGERVANQSNLAVYKPISPHHKSLLEDVLRISAGSKFYYITVVVFFLYLVSLFIYFFVLYILN